MTLSEIVSMLEEAGIPVAYRAFEVGNAPAPPFICYLFASNMSEAADDANYVHIEALNIELYTDAKDFSLETTIETILTEHDLAFSRDETWLDDERMQMTIYTTEVLINE